MKAIPNTFFLTLITGVIAFSSLNAAVLDRDFYPDDDKKTKVKRADSTDNNNDLLIENEAESPDSSLILFPSNDIYCNWDTITVHPYDFSDCFRSDSVSICLVDVHDNPFVLPFKGMITSQFGWRKYRPHYGTDIDLELGDTVVSAFDGMVRIAKSHVQGYGNVVIIRHENGLETVYAHLSKMLVDPGQKIKAGEILGLGGNTGRSYGAHLHFEIRYLGQALDTEDFIDFATGDLKSYEFMLRKNDVDTKYDLRAMHTRHRHDVGALSYVKTKNGGSYKIYKVRSGDNLGRIAQHYHTTVNAICKKNGIKPTKILQIGEKLRL